MAAYVIILVLTFLVYLPYEPAIVNVHGVNRRSKQRNRLLSFLFVLAVILVFGLRYEVGTDYASYIGIFERVRAGDAFVARRFEPGFVLLNRAFVAFGLPPQTIILTIFAFSFLLLYSTIPHDGMIGLLSLVLLFTTGPVFAMTNIVRQYFAISICVFVFIRWYDKKPVYKLLGIALAFLFHFSAPAFLLAFLVPRKRIRPWVWIVGLVGAFFLSGNIIGVLVAISNRFPAVFGRFIGYLESTQLSRPVSGLGIRAVLEPIAFVSLSAYTRKFSEKQHFMFNLVFIGMILRFATLEVVVFSRVASYFLVFLFLALPQFICVPRSKSVKALVIVSTILYSLLLFSRILSSAQWVPYQSVLF